MPHTQPVVNTALARGKSLVAIAVLGMVAGCAPSNTWDYPVQSGPQNMTIMRADIQSEGSTKRHANLAMYHEVANCQFEYIGSIVSEGATTAFVLPVGQRMNLQMNFVTFNNWEGNQTISAVEYLFTARPERQYEAVLTNNEIGYDYELVEINPATGSRRVIPMVNPTNCS
jgi:hypothetical protein